jgi:RNA methyltransferase, TrmH family
VRRASVIGPSWVIRSCPNFRVPPRPKSPSSSTSSTDQIISSRQNPLLKEIIAIRDERDSPLLFLEGPKLIAEALSAECKIEMLIVSEEFPRISFLEPIVAKTPRVVKVSDSVFQAISDVENPQGLLAIARGLEWSWEILLKRKPAPIVILDGLQDPGNAAAIIRTAEAAGAAGVVTTPKTVHLFSPKALRGAMGSSLRVPVLEHVPIEKISSLLHKADYKIATTPLEESKNTIRYDHLEWQKPWALVLGQEAKGVSSLWEKHADAAVHIPMQKPMQSLNVGAATAVLLYESYKNRSFTR